MDSSVEQKLPVLQIHPKKVRNTTLQLFRTYNCSVNVQLVPEQLERKAFWAKPLLENIQLFHYGFVLRIICNTVILLYYNIIYIYIYVKYGKLWSRIIPIAQYCQYNKYGQVISCMIYLSPVKRLLVLAINISAINKGYSSSIPYERLRSRNAERYVLRTIIFRIVLFELHKSLVLSNRVTMR